MTTEQYDAVLNRILVKERAWKTKYDSLLNRPLSEAAFFLSIINRVCYYRMIRESIEKKKEDLLRAKSKTAALIILSNIEEEAYANNSPGMLSRDAAREAMSLPGLE